MGTQATLVYTVKAVGTKSTVIQPFVAVAPIPREVLTALGLRVLSDSISLPAVNPVVRTIVLGFGPSIAAVVAPQIQEGHIIGMGLTGGGNDYVVPPIIRANNNDRTVPLVEMVNASPIALRPPGHDAIFDSWLNVHDVSVTAPGAGYGAATCAFLGGLPPAGRDFSQRGGAVRYINIADPGRGYPSNAVLTFLGGGNPTIQAQGVVTFDPNTGAVSSISITNMGSGYTSIPEPVLVCPLGSAQPTREAKLFAAMAEGRPAQATVTVALGQVTGIAMVDSGDNYVEAPDVPIYDPAGLGAIVEAHMQLGRVDVIDPGSYYGPLTTISVTPAFQDYFPPPNANQDGPFWQLMQGIIQKYALSPVVSAAPVIA